MMAIWLIGFVCGMAVLLVGALLLVFPPLRLRKKPKVATPQHETHLDWCDGCQNIRPSTQMGFDAEGHYRCTVCRGVPEQDATPESWLKAKEQMADKVSALKHLKDPGEPPLNHDAIVGHTIELDYVPSGQKVIAQGSNASIRVKGDVHSRARLIAQGSNASIVVRGGIGAKAWITAQGLNATVSYHRTDPTAKIIAQGFNSSVKRTS